MLQVLKSDLPVLTSLFRRPKIIKVTIVTVNNHLRYYLKLAQMQKKI